MALRTLENTNQASDAIPIAQEISRAICQYIDVQAQVLKKSPEDSLQNLAEANEFRQQKALTGDPKCFSWMDYHALSQRDPELAQRRWQEVKNAARNELATGHRAAAALDSSPTSNAWQRAQFLAVRDGLSDEWNPQNGIERSLIDTMAQAFSAQLFWQERMICYACVESDNDSLRKEDCFQLPRVSDAKAVEQAAQMIDRFNRIFMRSLRALRDIRRHAPTLVVHNATHVNVAENQVHLESE